jgi:multiple sugar transport system permease protein
MASLDKKSINQQALKEMKQSSGKVGLTIHRVICYAVLIFVTILSLLPFYLLLINATRAHADIQNTFSMLPGKSFFINLSNVLNDTNTPVLQAMLNSFIVAGCAAGFSVYFSALTAYGVFAYDFKFKKLAHTFILLIMMVPTQVSALGFVNEMRTFGLIDTFIPLIIPAIAAPVTYFFIIQYMESSLPLEIVEAARIDGGNEFYNFNKIILPIVKPAMAVQAIFAFVGSWNNYFMPALILENKKTLPILIAALRSADYAKFDMGKVYVLLAITIFPLIIVYLFLSKFIIRGIALGGVKG